MSTSEDPSGTSTSPAPLAASTRRYTPPECLVEVEIKRGTKAIPKTFRVNGFEIPNVIDVTVLYGPNEPRRVVFEVVPTDFVEVDPESEQSTAEAGTVVGP